MPAGSKPPTCDRYLISKQNASDSTSLVKQHRAKLLRCCRISCLNNITALWLAIEPSFIRLHAKQARKHASTHARTQASKQASTQASKQGRKEASGHGFFCPVWVLIPPCHTCCFFKTLCRVLFPPCAPWSTQGRIKTQPARKEGRKEGRKQASKQARRQASKQGRHVTSQCFMLGPFV